MAKQAATSAAFSLEFEKPVIQLEKQIAELVNLQETKGKDFSSEVNTLRQSMTALLRKTYQNLTAWETVQVARHPARPQTRDYIDMIVKDFDEVHGDRRDVDRHAPIVARVSRAWSGGSRSASRWGTRTSRRRPWCRRRPGCCGR